MGSFQFSLLLPCLNRNSWSESECLKYALLPVMSLMALPFEGAIQARKLPELPSLKDTRDFIRPSFAAYILPFMCRQYSHGSVSYHAEFYPHSSMPP